MPESMGLIRYSITIHFKDNGLLHDNWQCAPNRVLVRCVAKATGEPWRASQESDDDYLRRYFDRQSLRILDPTEDLPAHPTENYARGVDLAKEKEKQGKDPVQSQRWKLLRKSVLERDAYTCRHCGSTQGTLHIDHVKPRYIWPELTWEPSNIVTLCKPCHLKKTQGEYKRCPPRSNRAQKGGYRRRRDIEAKRIAGNA